MANKVIDVSNHNGAIDFKKVKADGVWGVILRAGVTGYGASHTMYKDERFETFYADAKAAGLMVGAYYYSGSMSEDFAVKEANFFVSLLQGKTFELPVYMDVEETNDPTNMPGLGKAQLTAIIAKWCETVEKAGYYTGIYTAKSWVDTYVDRSLFDRFTFWLAHWTAQTDYAGEYTMWQYSATGSVSGINGNVDMDECYKDFPEIIRGLGLNGLGTQTKEPEKETQSAANKNYLTYPMKNMYVSQNYDGGYSHAPHSNGTPPDYPIDDCGAGSDREGFYCPCDEMRIAHIYGVGTTGTNTIWLESTSKVVMPSGEDYVTILVMHPNDDTLGRLVEGQTFKRGEKMFIEGNDGWATGYHFHMAVGTGKFTGSGWVANSNGKWVNKTTGKQLKPEEAFWIDDGFTKVLTAGGITFKHLTETETKEVVAEQQKEPAVQPETEQKTEQKDTNVIYRVQIGAYRNRENADALAEKAKAAGFSASVMPYIKGDVDGDGEVTAADARAALRIATGLEEE